MPKKIKNEIRFADNKTEQQPNNENPNKKEIKVIKWL